MSRLARLIAEADEDEVAASLTQIPLRLAWSLTIHKCQGNSIARVFGAIWAAPSFNKSHVLFVTLVFCTGMSLDFVEIDLSRTFEHGMIYTALSR